MRCETAGSEIWLNKRDHCAGMLANRDELAQTGDLHKNEEDYLFLFESEASYFNLLHLIQVGMDEWDTKFVEAIFFLNLRG